MPGVVEFLANCALPMAVASSSRVEYLQWALSRLGLAEHFGVHLYSAEGMARGKPHPDIYLRAARGRGIAAERCLTIEARRSAPAPPSPRE